MTFHSILFDTPSAPETTEAPACLHDLNLDQVFNEILSSKAEYDLAPYFYTLLGDADAIRYRHEVMRDLEDPALLAHIRNFAEQMVLVRRYLGMVRKLTYNYHIKGWHLEAALTYCAALTDLARNLDGAPIRSRGLLAFRKYLAGYVRSPGFETLRAEAGKVKAGLADLRYCIILQGSTVRVRRYEGESDYSEEVERTFEKFKRGAVKDYRSKLFEGSGMNHVEAQILELVARLYPEPFAALDRFHQRHENFLDPTLCTFDRQIQFYVGYLEYMAGVRARGLTFCYPAISEGREERVEGSFDLALAGQLRFGETPVICNDYHLTGPEQVIVVTGPNQGGKTTFARMFGQLHYLAALGLPVPGRQASLCLCDQVLTHFEREEEISNLRGKLQDDLVRIKALLDGATDRSVLILNEIFSSTSLQDAAFLSREIMTRVMERGSLCVWVTFLDELASYNERTVSMVSTVVPERPSERTFRIVRRAADGLAYALSLAEKHRLTYPQLKDRIQP